MGVFALDLRADPDNQDGLASRPLFNFKAKTPADAKAPRAVANNEAADDRASRRLQVALDRGIDPAYDLTVENRGESHPVGGARRIGNPFAKVVNRTRIPQLAAQFGGHACIVDREAAY